MGGLDFGIIMRLNGKKAGVNRKLIVLREDLAFMANAVMDMTEFDTLCPEPKVPEKKLSDGSIEYVFDHPAYLAQQLARSANRINYMILKSLTGPAGEPLEWEIVSLANPKSWSKMGQELTDFGLSATEIQRVKAGVLTANSLNEAALQEARESFVRGMAEQKENTSSLPTEQATSPSGELAPE